MDNEKTLTRPPEYGGATGSVPVGWKCPCCGRGNAPWLAQCPCNLFVVTTPPQDHEHPFNPPFPAPTTGDPLPHQIPVTVCSTPNAGSEGLT
jgi:hypothetical protein